MNVVEQRRSIGRSNKLFGYIFAVIAVGIMVGIDVGLKPVFPSAFFRIPFVLLIGLVAYLYGRGPGLTALTLSIVGYSTIYLPDAAGRVPYDSSDWAQYGVFIIGSILSFLAMANLHDSSLRLRERTAQLEEEMWIREKMQQDQARLAAIVESSDDAIIAKDLDGNILSWNKGAERIYGYAAEEAIGRNVSFLIPPSSHNEIPEILSAVGRGEYVGHYETERLTKDGRIRQVSLSVSPIRDGNGHTIAASTIARDITEQKQAEKALRESEERFRAMVDAMPQLAWMAQPDGYIFWYNRRWYEYTGTTPEQMEGWGWQRVHDPEMLPKVMERWKRSIETGELFDMEFPLLGVDGRFRWFLTRVVPLKDLEGRITRWFGTNTDISEKREAEEEIRELNASLERRVQERTAELENANKELEAFSYSVSHDLRAPLRAIDGFSNTLLKYYRDSLDARGQDYLQRVRAAAQRMAQLIDDILGLSRAGRAEMHRQRVDMSTMTREILSELQKSQPERKAQITIAPDMVVDADSHLLRVALGNLLGNAWKFTGNREVARIEVGSIEQNGERVYYIRDNGAGFNSAYADKLFSPFQRLHTESEFPGTGIGLALVQRILRRHGGRIWAESEVDQGATFYFTLGEGAR